jgi:hypothetical protein
MALFTAIGTALGATSAAAFTTGLGATALAGGAIGYSMYSAEAQKAELKKAQGAGMAQMPQSPAPVAPTMDDAAKAAAMKLEDKKRALAANETVYTNPLGLKDEAAVVRKTLLGG